MNKIKHIVNLNGKDLNLSHKFRGGEVTPKLALLVLSNQT